MAWTAPRTWVSGEVPTAALFNTYLRDNQTALSGHGHTGSAGDGTRALKPQTINLVATGTPGAPGTGTMILYGSNDLLHLRTSSTVTVFQSTTHEHTIGLVATSGKSPVGNNPTAGAGSGSMRNSTNGDAQATSIVVNLGGTGERSVVMSISHFAWAGSVTVRLTAKRDGTLIGTSTGTWGSSGVASPTGYYGMYGHMFLETGVAAGSHTYQGTVAYIAQSGFVKAQRGIVFDVMEIKET